VETPPRTWGRLLGSAIHVLAHGNTPTDVGKTENLKDAVGLGRKHPHGRGEDRDRGHQNFLINGNTPTDVGKTSWKDEYWTIVLKHPHGRGED